jgi:hypothetical protein
MWMSAKSLFDRPPRHERVFYSITTLVFDVGKPLAKSTCSSFGKLSGVADRRSVSIRSHRCTSLLPIPSVSNVQGYWHLPDDCVRPTRDRKALSLVDSI